VTVALALAAVLAFAFADLANTRLARRIGATPLLTWVLAIALVPTMTLSLTVGGFPSGAHGGDILRAAGAGVLTVAALGSLYAALRVGRLALVAPIVALDGGFAALAALAMGHQIGVLSGVGLTLAVVGGLLACGVAHEGKRPSRARRPIDRGAVWALASACCFAGSYLLYGVPDGALPTVTWVAISLAAGLACILPFVVRRRALAAPRAAWPLLIASGLLQALGMTAMVAALTRGPVTTAAVLLAQVATAGAVLGAVVLHERLARREWLGVGMTVVAATLLASR
jgi:drug/metabolite transporter (DMT)-like permease